MPLSTEVIVAVAQGIVPGAKVTEHHGDLAILATAPSVIDLLTELRDNPDTQFDQLVDVTVVDWARPENRFEVVYFLYSIKNAARVRITVELPEHSLHISTAVDVWESANWYEREAYDMYGVIFDGHPDLRRFYMPEDFMDKDGTPLYPLRKDFPLMGIPGSLPLPEKEER